jgi:hypothetical protein
MSFYMTQEDIRKVSDSPPITPRPSQDHRRITSEKQDNDMDGGTIPEQNECISGLVNTGIQCASDMVSANAELVRSCRDLLPMPCELQRRCIREEKGGDDGEVGREGSYVGCAFCIPKLGNKREQANPQTEPSTHVNVPRKRAKRAPTSLNHGHCYQTRLAVQKWGCQGTLQ